MKIHEFINYNKKISAPILVKNPKGAEIGMFEAINLLDLFADKEIIEIGAIKRNQNIYILLIIE